MSNHNQVIALKRSLNHLILSLKVNGSSQVCMHSIIFQHKFATVYNSKLINHEIIYNFCWNYGIFRTGICDFIILSPPIPY